MTRDKQLMGYSIICKIKNIITKGTWDHSTDE